jgi:thymidylate kinase
MIPANRIDVLEALVDGLGLDDGRWALQGDEDAAARWSDSSGLSDLDVWVHDALRARISSVLAALGAVRLHAATDPRRLRHDQWLVVAGGEPTIVDVTVGDLRVGPVLLWAAEEVETVLAPVAPIGGARRLTGAALVCDAVARPLLRGRIPAPTRLAGARAAWRVLPGHERAALVKRLGDVLGASLAGDVVAALAGGRLESSAAPRARRRLAWASLNLRSLPATWRQRRSILPSQGPFGLPNRGVVVALVGTDGSGKSTVSAELQQRLRRLGVPVETAYFGMARENLPGLGALRRLARTAVGEAPDDEAFAVDGTGGTVPACETPKARSGAPAALLVSDRKARTLRHLASWVYAADYAWRAATRLAPARARRRVVVCDRWVTDLRRQPLPGSRASRVLERLVRPPDVLALPDAPVALLYARKPERAPDEMAAEQEALRSLVQEMAGRCTTLVLDTSGHDPDPVAPLVRAVLAASHTIS